MGSEKNGLFNTHKLTKTIRMLLSSAGGLLGWGTKELDRSYARKHICHNCSVQKEKFSPTSCSVETVQIRQKAVQNLLIPSTCPAYTIHVTYLYHPCDQLIPSV